MKVPAFAFPVARKVYRLPDRWSGADLFIVNNTKNYNTVTGGFFIRYLFKPQFATENYPTEYGRPRDSDLCGFRARRSRELESSLALRTSDTYKAATV